MGNILRPSAQRLIDSDPDVQKRHIVPNHLVPETVHASLRPNAKCCDNSIKTTKYTLLSFIPLNLYEQLHRFANIYFIFIVVLNWVPAVNAFAKEVAVLPVIFVLTVTAVKDAVEDYRRHKADAHVNSLPCRIYCRRRRRYVRRQWKDIEVGDIIHLSCNEVIPADLVLLKSSDRQGVCHVDTSSMDGENNLKTRLIVRDLHQQGAEFHPTLFTYTTECELPNIEIYKFNGTMITQLSERIPLSKENLLLRECIIRNTDFVEGIVVYAGHETKAMMNNRGPRHKRSLLEQQLNRDVIWCVIVLFLMCFGCSLGSGLWLEMFEDSHHVVYIPYESLLQFSPAYQGFIRFWTYIILFQVMIPLSLYISVELVKLGQVYLLQNDLQLYDPGSGRRALCRALNICEQLGRGEHVFCDKTGTLTENQMLFRRCTVGGVDYTAVRDDDLTVQNRCSAVSNAESCDLGDDSFCPDPILQKELAEMRLCKNHEVPLEVPEQARRIWDFFLLLAVCNTVVVTSHAHVDKMDSSGMIHEDSDSDDNTSGRYTRLSDPRQKQGRLRDLTRLFKPRPHGEATPPQEKGDGGGLENGVEELKGCYEAESPDELALVNAAHVYGCRLVRRGPKHVAVWLPGEGEVCVRLLHILPFDAVRKRMSVIIEHPATGEITLLCKGADSAIFDNLHPSQDENEVGILNEKTKELLMDYAKEGLRTLCMATRVISDKEYKSWLRDHMLAETASENREDMLYQSACRIETSLQLLGATGIEDKLQPGVAETIGSLREAGMKVWVLTGDKQETAMNIAQSCHLIDYDQELVILNVDAPQDAAEVMQRKLEQLQNMPVKLFFHNPALLMDCPPTNHTTTTTADDMVTSQLPKRVAMVIDGKSLDCVTQHALESDFLKLTGCCESILCCRATPHQKAKVVKLVRDKLHKLTVAVGDGANDVGMLQTADIGIGVAGKEGMQAVMASDFAIARFRFLKRLLLVHGHWSHDRLARTLLYMFYKNSVFVFLLMWFQLYSGFSGSIVTDDINLIFFNLIYTALPPIVFGIFDRAVDEDSLMRHPQLYKQISQVYKSHSYFLIILESLWQSLVQFFVPYFTYSGGSTGLFQFGITCYSGCVFTALMHLSLETRSWTIIHVVIMLLSALSYVLFNLAFHAVCKTCSPPANPYWVAEHSMASPVHWLCTGLVIVIALAPRFIVRTIQSTRSPPIVHENKHRTDSHDYFASWSAQNSECVIEKAT